MKNKMETIGFLEMNESVKRTMKSLNPEEQLEFISDTNECLNQLLKELKELNESTCITSAAQRIGDRHFITELCVNISDKENPYFSITRFEEVGIDEYLDHMLLMNQKEKNEGFVKIKTNDI